MDDDDTRLWRIGELAAASGLSVRALRHYDELGLLVPADRTGSGYRLYSTSEVQRLYRITALRRLGLGLEAIGAALDGDGADLATVIRRQREAVVRELAERAALLDRLDALCAELDRGEEPSGQELITTMEAMQMYEKYYTEDQLERLRLRGEQLGPERIAEVQSEWTQLFGTLREARSAGVAPGDSSLDHVRAHARELVALFTGGEPDMAASLGRMWTSEDPEAISRGALDRELAGYVRQVFSAGEGVGG
ncbi:MAG TPA: MerR family transcriptional regulator [Solirubrobacteraceae bacterium]|nr:MerR family transcriptional regulator [Solirubrobacteraceae bacterium]